MSDKNQGYRFLEHTTDAYVESWAPTLEGAFSHAAEGLFATMLNIEAVEPENEEKVRVEGHDQKELLYNWLEDLLLRFEIGAKAYSEFHVEKISQDTKTFSLQATILGEKYSRLKHGSRTEVKGVTYHLMEIERNQGEARIRFLLDL